jgi:cytochrome c oxidase subunit 4
MENVHKEPNYMAVFYWLGALTIAELVVIYLPISKLIIGALLILLALSKASLVALYYMHLKFEKRTLGIIALTPLIICALLVFSLLPDLTAVHHRSRATASQAVPAEHK